MIIVDAHEDLAFNVLADGRDYLTSAYVTRAAEAGVAVIFATITTIPRERAQVGLLSYANPEASYQQALPQLAIYRRWAATHPQVGLIERRGDLDAVLASWATPPGSPDQWQIGLVLLMENADSIRAPDEVGFWYEQGLRLIGPAWETNRYTTGCYDSGPLTALGRELLVGLGTDFDGGQGAETTPAELDTIADLPLVADALAQRGYDAVAVEAVMGGNWLRVLKQHLPL